MTDRLGAGTRGGDEYPTDKEMGEDGQGCEHEFVAFDQGEMIDPDFCVKCGTEL